MNQKTTRRWPQIATLVIFLLALGYLAWLGWGMLPQNQTVDNGFNGERALSWAEAQCEIGPRPAGSEEAFMVGEMIIGQMNDLGWDTRVQDFNYQDVALRNIVSMTGEEGPLLVIATHYDTRRYADRDPNLARRQRPTPGGNEGASGVAVLLELARALDRTKLRHRLWLVFLDGEADSGINGWEAGVGARELTKAVDPDAVIYLHLVGGKEARFPKLADATDLLQDQLWSEAERIELSRRFPDIEEEAEEDARTAFLQEGIPTAAITQPDYPYFRTTDDDCRKLDPTTMQDVGRLLEYYLEAARFLNVASTLNP
jgi:hypothetical protein